jgi:hypothetical protein
VDDASLLEKRTRIIFLVPSPSTLSPHDELLNAVSSLDDLCGGSELVIDGGWTAQ